MIDISQSIENITMQLINIPSVTGNEDAILKEIKSCIISLGLTAEEYSRNLIVKIIRGKEKTIGLIGHLDTVIPSSAEQTKARFENSRIYGLGAVDMKGGLACIFKLMHDITKEKFSPENNLVFIFYRGEEGPLPNGLTNLIKDGLLKDIDYAVTLEPTDGKFVAGCLGRILAKYKFKGKSAHSAYSWRGENAIYKSSEFIKKISEIKIKELNNYKECINITKIESSGATNQIPEECVVYVDYRFSPLFSEDEAINNLTKLAGKPDELVDISLGAVTNPDNEFINRLTEKLISQGWTDIAQLNRNNITAVNFGPGNLELAHSKDESISIKELEEFYKRFLEFLKH